MRNEPLDHVLLHGPPGWARPLCPASLPMKWGSTCALPPAPPLKGGDLAALLTNLNENDIPFVDEIHRPNRSVEEVLYPAMEDYAIDIIIGKGPFGQLHPAGSAQVHPDRGHHPGGPAVCPLRDRFGVTLRLELYTPEELALIVTRSAGILEGAHRGGRRHGDRPAQPGTPHRQPDAPAGAGLRPAVRAGGVITKKVADEALTALEIDSLGVGLHRPPDAPKHHRKLPGRPCGLRTLAATINEESVTPGGRI